jgi:hypothetical protein
MENYYILYETTNLINGKKYRGIHKTTKLEDGYLGSGTAFTEAIKKYGKKNFNREILQFCDSYDELIKIEEIYVDNEWVKDTSNYNLKTGGVVGILSQDSRNKISETLKRKYESGEKSRFTYTPTEEQKSNMSFILKERYKIIEHHLKGVEPWNKGLKGVQEGWNKGLELGPMTDEEKEKRSKTLKERWKTQEHHSKGVEPWNKGTKGLQEAWNKGKEMEKTECPHCGKFVDIGNGKRWHFDKCKQNPNV